MAWTDKILPAEDIAVAWTVVPEATAHWSVLDETEDDLNTGDYIHTDLDVTDDFRMDAGSGNVHLNKVEFNAAISSLGGNADTAHIWLDGAWTFIGAIASLSSGGVWEWRTTEAEIEGVLDLSDFRIRLQGAEWTSLKIAAFYVRLYLAPQRLRTAHSPTGQRFRVFDDGDEGAVSFERLDHPGGAWSTPTQPFGEGSNSPEDRKSVV